MSIQWRGHHGVSNHRRLRWMLNRLFNRLFTRTVMRGAFLWHDVIPLTKVWKINFQLNCRRRFVQRRDFWTITIIFVALTFICRQFIWSLCCKDKHGTYLCMPKCPHVQPFHAPMCAEINKFANGAVTAQQLPTVQLNNITRRLFITIEQNCIQSRVALVRELSQRSYH